MGFHLLAFFSLLFSAALAGNSEDAGVQRESWIMGTRLLVRAEAQSQSLARDLTEEVLDEIEGVDRFLSTWKSDSELSRLNRAPPHTPIPLSPELYELLAQALESARLTGGAFDPAVGALIEAWGLRNEGRIPGPGELQAARGASGVRLFRMDARRGTLTRLHPQAWLDAGGFGKGAALRSAAELLAATRPEEGSPPPRVLLDLGGQIWAQASASHPWHIGVAHPAHRERSLLQLSIHGVSVATSGTSERRVEAEGRQLGHILDPRSGRPAPSWGSVTVVSPDPLEADILATALYVMGPQAGLSWISGHPTVGALFLESCPQGIRATWNRAMEPWFLTPPARTEGGFLTSSQRPLITKELAFHDEADQPIQH